MALQPAEVNNLITSGNMRGLKCFHLNIRSSRNKEDILNIFLENFTFPFDVVMLTETWSTAECDAIIDANYKTFFLNRSKKRGGGIQLNIRKCFQCDLLDQFAVINDYIECLAVVSEPYIFAVIYRPPDGCMSSFFQFLETLLDFSNKNDYTTILGGDLNIDLLTSSTSEQLLQTTLFSQGYSNMIQTPTRITTKSSTLIDLFITNLPKHETTAGTVSSNISDHLAIVLLCKTTPKRTNTVSLPSRKIQNISESTISIFRSKLIQTNWSDVYSTTSADDAYNNFLNKLIDAYSQSFPFITAKKFKKSRKPWITKESLKMIKKKDKLFHRFLSTRDTEDWKAFKKYRNKTNAILRKEKQRYLYLFFETGHTIKSDVMWKKLNELLNRNPHCQNTHELIINDKVICGQELAEEFNNHLVNQVTSAHCVEATGNIARNLDSIFFVPTSESEVHDAFSSLRNSSARDINDLQLRPIKGALDLLTPHLTHIYNLALSTGVFPAKMQISKVITIFKGGDRNNLSNYRPISLLPIFSKGLEKVIHIRIINFFEKHNLLTPTQFGFRKGKSTELALLTQKEIILKAFEEKEAVIGIYIDFSKAFDRLNHITLLKKLEIYGVRGTPLALITSYLQHRRQSVSIDNNMSSYRPVTTGIPQGSILGPLLFNIYVNDITSVSPVPHYISYADDTTLLFHERNFQSLEAGINAILQNLYQWSKANSLDINTKKTKAVMFTPRQSKAPHFLNITLGSEPIEFVDSVKTLGVYLHKNMLWDTHVNYAITKISKSVGILARFHSFLPQAIKLHIYNALILSHISYCFLVWGRTTVTNLNRLHVLQKKIYSAYRRVDSQAHTGEYFMQLNVTSVHNLYLYTLAKRYKQQLRKSQQELKYMAQLTRTTHVRDTRFSEPWKVPYSRTNYGQQMLRHSLPTLLNNLEHNGIDINHISISKIRSFLSEQASDNPY